MSKKERFLHPDYNDFGFNKIAHRLYGETAKAVEEWGVMGFIGAAIGKNNEDIFTEEDVQDLVNRLGNLDLVARTVEYEGEDGPLHDPAVYHDKTTVEKVAHSLTEDRWYKVGDLKEINTLKQLESAYHDAMDNGGGRLVYLKTAEVHEKIMEEQRRKNLEQSAKHFAASNKVKVGTFEFIRAVERAIQKLAYRSERWNDGETRMEEWAACMYSGAGRETYFDDLNYVNGQLGGERDDLEGIMDWLQSECPLLMAKYEEMKLSGEWAEEDAVLAEAEAEIN